MRIPRSLTKNPIIDATAEVRFSSSIPDDAIVGLVYSQLRDTFGKPESLPVLQIPAPLRESDSNLKFQPCYRFIKPGNVLLVGPHTIALSTFPYSNWGAAAPILTDVLQRLHQVNLFESIERIGLRYINFFEEVNIFDKSTLVMEVRKESIAGQSVSLRTETMSNDFKVVTQLLNTATAEVAGTEKKGSIFDLDISKEGLAVSPNSLPAGVMDLFVVANEVADAEFFKLLREDFVATFGPQY